MPSVYALRDDARASGRLVFSHEQLAAVSGVPRDQARVYASRLVSRGLATRVAAGVVSFAEDPFVIATQLVEPSYISFLPALHLLGVVPQVPSVVECVTTRRSLAVDRPRIRYHKVAPSLFFGYDRVDRQGSYVFVARKEKALLDMVYFGGSPTGEEMAVDGGALARMAEAYLRVGGWRGERVARWVERLAP